MTEARLAAHNIRERLERLKLLEIELTLTERRGSAMLVVRHKEIVAMYLPTCVYVVNSIRTRGIHVLRWQLERSGEGGPGA